MLQILKVTDSEEAVIARLIPRLDLFASRLDAAGSEEEDGDEELPQLVDVAHPADLRKGRRGRTKKKSARAPQKLFNISEIE